MFAAALLALALAAGQPPAEVLTQIQVHGNTITPEAEVLGLAAVSPGAAFTADTVALVAERLRDSGRFESVEVRKRFASIEDPTQVLLVIIVDEGRVGLNWNRGPGEPIRAERRGGLPFMLAPVLDAEDGYGLTYGGRIAFPGVAGAQSRVAVPLTWGGEKQAAIEFDKQFGGSAVRFTAGARLTRRTNPHFEADDSRSSVWGRVERPLLSRLRAAATMRRERVRFAGTTNSFTTIGVEAVFDTRLDPFLARNAVYGRAAVERAGLTVSPLVRAQLDARGHIGLPGQAILVVRGLREDADAAQPAFLKPLMGGARNLRGFRAGYAAGDTLVAGSVELRLPLTSPLNVGRLGVSGFLDVATSYAEGQRLSDQRFERGVGGSVWAALPVFRMELSTARGVGESTRVHFDATVTF